MGEGRPAKTNRLLAERPSPRDGVERGTGAAKGKRATRTVTVNLAESPLGWLRARGLVSERQFEAGERLRGLAARADRAERDDEVGRAADREGRARRA